MRKKVLILDDDIDINELITYILEDNGYETEALTSGETIFESLDAFKPDVVLMDVMLGNMDGREICRAIKAKFNDPPIILISASHNMKNELNKQGGADDFIAKPFNIEELLAKVDLYCCR